MKDTICLKCTKKKGCETAQDGVMRCPHFDKGLFTDDTLAKADPNRQLPPIKSRRLSSVAEDPKSDKETPF
jgi:hypothetical protein